MYEDAFPSGRSRHVFVGTRDGYSVTEARPVYYEKYDVEILLRKKIEWLRNLVAFCSSSEKRTRILRKVDRIEEVLNSVQSTRW